MILFHSLILLAAGLASTAAAQNLNSFELVLFYDMYRMDWEMSGESSYQIAKGCKDCTFEQFLRFIDRMRVLDDQLSVDMADLYNPELYDMEDWELEDTFIYDGKKLLGSLLGSDAPRPGHPTVIETLTKRVQELRQTNENHVRLDQVEGAMVFAHYDRRRSQAKAFKDFVDERLRAARAGLALTRTVTYERGSFEEVDALKTIETQSPARRPLVRSTLMSIARDMHNRIERRDGAKFVSKRQESAFLEGASVMSLQRSLDAVRAPVRRKC